MRLKLLSLATVATLSVCSLYADFTYEQTTQMTGGALIGVMKFAGVFSKDARRANAPTRAIVSIKGNRMVHKTDTITTITDLDNETITTIHTDDRTYSVMTFAQMKQALEAAMEKTGQAQTQTQTQTQPPVQDVDFDINIKDTGARKNINGNDAHEVVVTFSMKGADAKSGARGAMNFTTDMWLAPEVAGYDQVRAFQRRMAEKLDWQPGSSVMGRPDIARAMSRMAKEGATMDGIPVRQIVQIGGTVEGIPDSDADGSQQQTQHQQAPPPSVGSALGSALGGRLGGLGGFGGRKKPQSQSDAAPDKDRPADGQTRSASGSLIEMTTELTSYSSSPADERLFQIPSGFRQFQEDLTAPGRRPARQ